MDKHDKHIDFFNELEPDFKQSESDLWAKIEEKSRTVSAPKVRSINYVRYSVAAAILLLIGFSLFIRF